MCYIQKWGWQVGGGVFLGEPIILESRRLLHFFPATVYDEIIQERSGRETEKGPCPVGFQNLSRYEVYEAAICGIFCLHFHELPPDDSVRVLPEVESGHTLSLSPEGWRCRGAVIHLLTALPPASPDRPSCDLQHKRSTDSNPHVVVPEMISSPLNWTGVE